MFFIKKLFFHELGGLNKEGFLNHRKFFFKHNFFTFSKVRLLFINIYLYMHINHIEIYIYIYIYARFR
jgi:hypothetical protein